MFKKMLMASVLALPLAAMADGLSYNYIQAGYVMADIDGGGDADGFGIGGAFLVNPAVFVQGAYSRIKLDGTDIEASTISGGLGFRHGLTETVDFTASANVVFAEVDAGSFGSDDDTGYGLTAGIRALVMPALELNAGANYTNVFDDGETSFGVGAVFSVTPQFALLGNGDFSSDANAYTIGARFMF